MKFQFGCLTYDIKKKDIPVWKDTLGRTLLMLALYAQWNADELSELIDQGADTDLNSKDDNGWTLWEYLKVTGFQMTRLMDRFTGELTKKQQKELDRYLTHDEHANVRRHMKGNI